MSKKILKYSSILLVIISLGMHFIFLNVPYEYDELFTAVTSNPTLPIGWILHNWLIVDVHPPLHNILLWVYNHFVPYGPEIWLRLPSVFCGLAALFLAWKLFPRRYGKTARWIFVTFLSCHASSIFYAQQARAYALMLCLSVPLTFLFLKLSLYLRKRKSISGKTWLYWGVLSLLLCWSHYFGTLFFGICSVLLWIQAVYKRINRAWAFGVPCVVLLCFLPWLIPNFLYNLSQSRFNGNWWANAFPWFMIIPQMTAFFCNYAWASWGLGLLTVSGWWLNYQDFKRCKRFAYEREILLLLAVILGVLGVVGILYLKMYLWTGRYFTELLPAFYLFITLSIVRLLKKSILLQMVYIAYILIGLIVAFESWRVFAHSHRFAARIMAQFYRDYAPEKELFVIAVEAFPPNAMQAMYAFYPNQIYGMNAKVTALYQLDEASREEALKRRHNALIWMPNCDIKKLNHISREWDRGVGIEGLLGQTCFLQLSEKGRKTDPAWKTKTITNPLADMVPPSLSAK